MMLFGTAALGKIKNVTVGAPWGSNSGAAPTNITSSTQTLTVPAGNAGSLHFSLSDATGGSPEYSKNGGGFFSLTDGANITFANGDTLRFRLASPANPGTSLVVTVTDNLRSAAVGSWQADVT